MCGIAGIFHPAVGSLDRAEVDAAALRRMTAALAHRGPDGDGFHTEPGIGLGHRRLAIIDIGGGQQPMYNEDGSVAIVFNGEIYNHLPLRQELQALGHVFRNRCDTEAIIHAWESWGPDCVTRLNGMFAFALWDRNQQCLFLARDRLGKKPIYYATLDNGRFVFASEMQALTTLPQIRRQLDPAAVDDFFAFGFIPDPGTIYRDVRRLPAGHSLLLDRSGHPPVVTRYWRVYPTRHQMDEAEAVQQLVPRLTASVKARLIADVPLGAFLSGGVDSSAVVALAAGLHDGLLSTFTIGFVGEADERRYAELVARRYRTAHLAEGSDAVDYIDAAREQGVLFGEPFADSSSVPTARVCELARRAVTVALSGDGGDEVFAGYRRYWWHRLADGVRTALPGSVRRRVVGDLARFYPKLDRAPRWLRAKYTLTEISLDSALGYYRTLCKLHDESRRALFSHRTISAIDGHDPSRRVAALIDEAGTDDPVAQAQYVDLNCYLPGDILTKVDRASMAHSLEVRAPLLDYEFIEWAAHLPSSLKLHGREGKFVLKRALEPVLPADILYRRKQGFAVSLGREFRVGAGRIRERLLSGPMMDCGLFDHAALTRLVDDHATGKFDHAAALWPLLVFEGFLAYETDLPAAPDSLRRSTEALSVVAGPVA